MNERVKKTVMPERYYSLDTNMSFDKIKQAEQSGEFLIARVCYYDSKMECLIVNLGNEFKGIIPLDEFTIYRNKKSDFSISPAVYSFIGKNICACVKEIDNDGTIILSRKANMIKAFNYLSHLENVIVPCSITSIVKYGAFVDVGHGINGLIHIKNFCRTYVENLTYIGFYEGKFIDAKIISTNPDNYQIDLTYKDLFDNLAYTFNYGDIIRVTVLSKVSETNEGYYTYINPNTTGIINPPFAPRNFKFPYGSKVLAFVKHSSKKNYDKLRLHFISFID